MPTVLFADLDALRLALASGAVPSAVGAAPARAGCDAHGRLWLQPAAPLPRGAVGAWPRLGAAVQGTSGAELADEVPCWQHLLPLRPGPADGTRPVLFAVPDGRHVPALVAEMRRLGAGQIGVR